MIRESSNYEEAVLNYAKVDEISQVLGFLPLQTSMNVGPILKAIEKNSSPPEMEDLAKFAENIESIFEIKTFMEVNKDKLTLFKDLLRQLILPDALVETFKGSFDDEGKLNAEKYKQLGTLRRQADSLRGRIVQIIQTLLRSQDMKDKLADKYVSSIYLKSVCVQT